MKRTLAALLAITLCTCSSLAVAASQDLAREAAALNQRSKAQLGVSIHALALLFNAQRGAYMLKYALVREGYWPVVQELQQAGLAKVTIVNGLPNGTEKSYQFVTLELTDKGQQIRNALEP